jgi:large subunit ribosomal protein L21
MTRSPFANYRPSFCLLLQTTRQIASFWLQSSVSLVFFTLPKNGTSIVSYCILETGSKQSRVSAGDTLEIERVQVEAGQTHTFDQVLLVNQDGQVKVGSPTVASASVVADVVEHKRGPKLIAFKMKRRKGYHRKVGHRQELTVVRIKEIKI